MKEILKGRALDGGEGRRTDDNYLRVELGRQSRFSMDRVVMVNLRIALVFGFLLIVVKIL